MPDAGGETAHIRVAAAGDLHCREDAREQVAESMARVAEQSDLILLCGDLTTHGEPEQATILADACRDLDVPVLAVLGNHDWHCNRAKELGEVLRDGHIELLERATRTLRIDGIDIGVVGLKGFVGGFSGSSHLPDFGEPLLRRVYRETSGDVAALDAGLREIALCPVRIVMLHYAPSTTTIEGEPVGIWAFLGNDRLAAPIAEHEPDLVLHGHAHAGTFQGAIGAIPVYNVSVPVIAQDFWIFNLQRQRHPGPAIH